MHFLDLFLKAGDQHPRVAGGEKNFSIRVNKNIAFSVNSNYSSMFRLGSILGLMKK